MNEDNEVKEIKNDNNIKEEPFIPKTKHKALKIILAILLLAILCVGGYLLYQDKFNNPKAIVKMALEDSKKSYKNLLDFKNNSNKYKFNGLIKFDFNLGNELIDITNIIKNIDLQFSGEIDKSESISNLNLNSKYKGDELLNINSYSEKNNTYILLEKLYDKYIKVDTSIKDESLINNIPNINFDTNEINKLIDSINNALNKEIDNLDLKKEDVTIIIDEKETNVLNNYVILKNKEVIDFIKRILKDLINDKDFISFLEKISNNNDIKNKLLNDINELDNTDFQGIYRINFYTDKSIFNKKLISVRQELTVQGVTTSINLDKINDDEFMLYLNSSGITTSIKIKRNNSNFNFNIKMNMQEMYANIEVNMNYEKIEKLNKPDLSNYIDAKDLTETDANIINEAFEKNEALNKLLEEIEKITKNEKIL